MSTSWFRCGRFAALLTLSLASVPALAQQAPQQPLQPDQGPGSSDYRHAEVRVSSGGTGSDAWFVFEPMNPRPVSAPVAVVMHGFGEFSGYDQLGAFIDHTARKGTVVIYPRWQTSYLTPCQGPFVINPCVNAAATAIKDALAYLEADPARVQPQTDRTSYFGHSFGGIVITNALNRHRDLGIPAPRAVFLDDPHDGGFTGDKEPALDDDLTGIPSATLFQCYSGAHGVFDDPFYLNPAKLKPDGSCNAVFPKLGHIPAANKDLVLLSEDAHGSPGLTSDHGTCNSVNPPDAYDWGFCWKIWDALRNCALEGKDCPYALGDTPEHRYIGTWSDGVPIIGLKVQEEAPIRAEPAPERQAAPAADSDGGGGGGAFNPLVLLLLVLAGMLRRRA